MERRLAAILAADVVGYSRLMGKDEMGTLATLKACEVEVIDPTVSSHNGRIFKRMGDGFLAVFASAVEAVECALDWQEKLGQRNDQSLRFRIGIDLGEVIAEADDIYGDGVNVAARLESLAQPGCIALSEDTFRQVKDRLDIKVTDLGEQELKNIARPVRVWEWRSDFSVPEPLRKAELQLPEKPSIILLAFRNLSGDKTQDFLAEGLRLDIQSALTQVSGVFLIALGTADAFHGATAREAGSSLRVRYALQCSVRTAGNRIRVTAELTDTKASEVVWAEQFDRVMDDTFALQDEITARVLTAMNVKLVAGEQAKIWHKSLKSFKTLERFYKGIHAFFEMSRDEIVRARQYFESVAEMQPDSAIGPTWVALCHLFELERGWSREPEETKKLARHCAEEASAKDDADGQAQTLLSHMHLMNRDYEAALEMGRAATATRPGCANSNGFFANVLHHCGENDEAIRHINLAIRYHPLNPPFFRSILAAVHRARNELESAIATATQLVETAPEDIPARLVLTSAYVRSDRIDLARPVASEIVQLEPDFSVKRFADSQCYRDRAYLEQFCADLRKSGLPD
ncbi:MAG: adenylate/guanylate cyclase domain-containing protein [Paracoccaceae bacterium]